MQLDDQYQKPPVGGDLAPASPAAGGALVPAAGGASVPAAGGASVPASGGASLLVAHIGVSPPSTP